MRHPLFHKLSDNKDFEENILRCPKPGSYSSMNVFLAAASMLRMPIDVLYPAVNSASSYLYRTMNCRIEFAHTSVARSVSLMWSGALPTTRPTGKPPWEANRIVPLVQGARGPTISLGSTVTFLKTRITALTGSSSDDEKWSSPNCTNSAPTKVILEIYKSNINILSKKCKSILVQTFVYVLLSNPFFKQTIDVSLINLSDYLRYGMEFYMLKCERYAPVRFWVLLARVKSIVFG